MKKHTPPIIYLDHSATTEPYPEVILRMGQVLCDSYGNPSSTHSAGRDARIIVEESRREIAQMIGAMPSEVFFTSGGTESDNTVLVGASMAGVRRIITSPIEHHAITSTASHLSSMGISIEYVRIKENGDIDLEHLCSILEMPSEGKTLVSLMHVQNEIGNIYDINAIGNLCHAHNAWFHTDAVQGMCHMDYDLKNSPVDFLSASAHKFYGPKGIGFLYVKSGIVLPSLLHGGEQERGMRSGTENVPAIAAMALALKMNREEREKDRTHILELKKYLISRLEEIEGIRFNGRCTDNGRSIPSIVSITLPIKKDPSMVLLSLDMKGVCVSAGSACMAGAVRESFVIGTLYGDNNTMKGMPTLRISMGKWNVKEEIDIAVEAIRALF
ncbi:MAG: cysteine desulfurase [Flavobacteriales bacterium]|nr:cysteine desulfurase [Flavobacteriales bacterium]MBQ1969230.1 cysteine desulfurase [Flavobacteriales bacterium]